MDMSLYNQNPFAYRDINKAAYKLTLERGRLGWSYKDLAEECGWSVTSCRNYYDTDFLPIPEDCKWTDKRIPSIDDIYNELKQEGYNINITNSVNDSKIHYIYEIYHIDRKTFPNKHYVGRTTDIIKRMEKEHFNPNYWIKSPAKLLYWNLKQDGIENYAYRIIETCTDEETAKIREEYWINELKTMAINGGFNERHEIKVA